MPGIFSRLKTWVAGEVLTHSDLNAEFDNIISNAAGDKMDGTSHNLAEMQQTEDPAPSGTPDLVQPISITDEIRRLRYAIKRIIGKTNWYETPDRSLTTVYQNAAHIFSPPSDSSYQDTGISQAVSAGIYDLYGYADLSWRGTAKFGAYGLQNSPGIGPHCFYLDPGRVDSASNAISLWFKNFAAGDTIIYNPHTNLRVYLNINGYIQADLTLATVNGGAKEVKTVVGSTSLAGNASFKHLLVSYSLKNSADDYLKVYIDGTLIGSVTVPMKVSLPKRNERVFLMGSNSSKTVSNTMSNAVVPESDGWTISSSGSVTGTGTVSNGILTINPAAGGRVYSKATPVSSGNVWYEYKFRLSEVTASSLPAVSPLTIGYFSSFINNNFNGTNSTEGHELVVFANQLVLRPWARGFPTMAVNAISATHHLMVDIDTSDWTVIAIEQTATQAKLYINGIYKGYVSSSQASGGSSLNNSLGFGYNGITSAALAKIQIEYFRYGTGSYSISANSSQSEQISDICLISGGVSNSDLIASLSSSSPFNLFGNEVNTRNTDLSRVGFLGGAVTATSTYTVGSVKTHSNGKTPISVNSLFSSAGTSLATAYRCFIYSSITGTNADGITAQPGQFAIDPGASTIGSGAISGELTCANSSYPPSINLVGTRVYPAGEVTFTLYAYNPNAVLGPLLKQVDISISQ